MSFEEYKSFIFICRTGSVTKLEDDQFERLKWLVNAKNPGFFQSVVAPDYVQLNKEFESEVKEQEKKSLEQLAKEAVKKASKPIERIVSTKSYARNATIAAYVKKRANGYCQLCGNQAPFYKDGEPYLECHHIEWLSTGGMDSMDNCVALCPNCHRKMHILNDNDDITKLKNMICSN